MKNIGFMPYLLFLPKNALVFEFVTSATELFFFDNQILMYAATV